MTTHTITKETTLTTEECCNCGVLFAMPQYLRTRRLEDHDLFWCPNGHSQHFTAETEAQRLKRELDLARAATARAREREAWESSRREAAEKSLSATRGHLTRLKTRAEAGVCIHCHRTFQNVARHMTAKHGATNESMTGPEAS